MALKIVGKYSIRQTHVSTIQKSAMSIYSRVVQAIPFHCWYNCEILYFRAPVSVVSNWVFNWLIKFNICSKPIRTYDVGAPSAITISLPGMDPADAERRR